jgi:hypothetical protein
MKYKGEAMTRERLFVFVAVVAAAVSGVAACVGAQGPNFSTQYLSFSSDGHLLREVQREDPTSVTTFPRIHAVAYDAVSGEKIHALDLGPDTQFLDATADGRTAVILVNSSRPDQDLHVSLVDMDTGHAQDLPANWFNADDRDLEAQISADGRLVSAYKTSSTENEIVTVYEWPGKKQVARQTHGFPAGGIASGGVTADGKIEFMNNRTGGDVVDPRTGRLLVNVVPNSYRSVDGAWVVEFPNPDYGGSSKTIPIKSGLNGELAGQLDIKIASDDEEEAWGWARGAFCGTSGRFIAASKDTVQAFAIPSGKKIAEFPAKSWQEPASAGGSNLVTVACSLDGQRVAIRNGARLTLHDLK